jgi:hypothetical protein
MGGFMADFLRMVASLALVYLVAYFGMSIVVETVSTIFGMYF